MSRRRFLRMKQKKVFTPFSIPVFAFLAVILLGTLALWLLPGAQAQRVGFLDSLFTATSAVCVTGLTTIEPGIAFTRTGHTVILVLMQLGGLGIITYSTLLIYLFSRQISLTDKVAVSQTLFYDSTFHPGRFVQRVVAVIILIELGGMVCFLLVRPTEMDLFEAAFLSVSSFCNAGFTCWPDGLARWKDSWLVCSVIMLMIELGGIGFFVIDEVVRLVRKRMIWRDTSPYRRNIGKPRQKPRLTFQSRIVLVTSVGLAVFGTLFFLLTGYFDPEWQHLSSWDLLRVSMFQSVTCRTAGFSIVDAKAFSDIALLGMVFLMLIGGSPGSSAGGVKTTTFRVLVGYMKSQLLGRRQTKVAGKAVTESTLNKAMQLFFFTVITIVVATLTLTMTEIGFMRHDAGGLTFLDVLYEVVSAYGTVGLTVGVSAKLTMTGKAILCCVMFIGRLGPIWLLATIQRFSTTLHYKVPDVDLSIG